MILILSLNFTCNVDSIGQTHPVCHQFINRYAHAFTTTCSRYYLSPWLTHRHTHIGLHAQTIFNQQACTIRKTDTVTPQYMIADFLSIFARSASVITPSEKVELTLIESPLRAFRWAQDEHRTLFLPPPQRVAQKRKVSKIWTISFDNSETVRDRMSVKVIPNIKSYTRAFDWYRPRWPWMTLNGVIALILRHQSNTNNRNTFNLRSTWFIRSQKNSLTVATVWLIFFIAKKLLLQLKPFPK